MSEYHSILSVALTFFLIAASPGPAVLSTALVSMNHGKKAGLLYGLGLSAGLAFWGIVAATGLGAIIESSSRLLFFLKLFGGLYLIYLGCLSAKSALNHQLDNRFEVCRRKWFYQGVALNLSNPKAVFAWLAALSAGLAPTVESLVIVVATSICMALGLLVYVIYVFIFSFEGIVARYQANQRWLDVAASGLFIWAGLALIISH